jgi:hypothetical protein
MLAGCLPTFVQLLTLNHYQTTPDDGDPNFYPMYGMDFGPDGRVWLVGASGGNETVGPIVYEKAPWPASAKAYVMELTSTLALPCPYYNALP